MKNGREPFYNFRGRQYDRSACVLRGRGEWFLQGLEYEVQRC